MSVNFPSSPEDGDVFSGYIYDATRSVWKKLSTEATLNIDDLQDVVIDSPENGQALIYDTSIEQWTNTTLVEPVLTLEGLSDTDIPEPLDGEILIYDSASGKWVNETADKSLNDLTDVEITTPSDDQFLVYDSASSNWINQTINLDFSGDFAPRFLTETDTRTTNYTITLNDINKVVPMNGTSLTVTIPNSTTTDFPLGSVVAVYNLASTDVNVVGAGGVTVRNSGLIDQYGEVSLRKRGANEWVLAGGVV
jgi:hypothetical protein